MRIFAILLTLLFSVICRTLPEKPSAHYAPASLPSDLVAGEVFAVATFEPKSGSKAEGRAWFTKSENGFHVVVKVSNVSAGPHGIHIHEKGDCSSADASSAGGHFNPTHLAHGTPNPRVHHVGDLGNIIIKEDGTGMLDLVIPTESFHKGFPDWTHIIGKSLVLHAKADDLVSQPAGNSGERIACGIITK